MRGEHAARERLERDRVIWIAHDAQPGDHVLDDVVLDQRAAARQPAGNPRSQQSSLEVLAELVPAVENCVVPPSRAGPRTVALQVLDEPGGFFLLVAECERS